MAQGKEWNQEEVIEMLKPYFKLGCTVNKACKSAGIAQSTVQTWVDASEELRLQIGIWQDEISTSARRALKKSIDEGIPATSLEWLKRKEKDEFSDRTETDVTTKGESININPETLAIAKKYEEEIKKGL